MPRVPNSPHRGNLRLISPACLTVFTGHREKCNQWSDLPENQQSWGRRNHPAKEMPLAQKPGSSYQGPGAQHLWGNADVCVSGFSALQISMKDNKTVSQYFQITAEAADSFPVCGLSTSSKVTLSAWRASHPHMTPIFLSWLRALEIRMIQINPHEIPKAFLSVIL